MGQANPVEVRLLAFDELNISKSKLHSTSVLVTFIMYMLLMEWSPVTHVKYMSCYSTPFRTMSEDIKPDIKQSTGRCGH